MKSKQIGRFFILLGIFMLVSAAAIVAYNINENKQSMAQANSVLDEIKKQIPDITEPKPDEDSSFIPSQLPQDIPATVINFEGKPYIGIISIPSLGIELPVINEWNYENLKIAPCRYYGSLEENNIIIAAHNYSSFFQGLDKLNSGDRIIFYDFDGKVHKYEVCETDLIGGYSPELMTADQNSWDLTLFTCNWSGRSRVTVRAAEIDE